MRDRVLTQARGPAWYASGMRTGTKLSVIFGMNFAASVAHYADNILRFAVYPDPPWLNPTYVDAAWFVVTPVGATAYVLFRLGKIRAALALSYAYGALGLLGLAHYLVAPPWRVSLSINALILLEAAAALILLAYTAGVHRRSRARAV
jgi:hypothetical protein